MEGVHTIRGVFGIAAWFGLATLLQACGEVNGTPSSARASGGGADGGAGGALLEGTGGVGAGGARSSGAGGHAVAESRDASSPPESGTPGIADSSVPLEASPPPSAIAARQKVTFEIRNDTGSDRYVVTAGNYCTAFDIYSLSDAGATRVPQALGFGCPCECPAAGETASTGLHRVATGETMTVSWDARTLVTWLAGVECSPGSGPPSGHSSELMGVRQPVPAGRYSVVIDVEPTLPGRCTGVGPDFDCNINYGPGGSGPSMESLCPAGETERAEFELPPVGDVVVPINLR